MCTSETDQIQFYKSNYQVRVWRVAHARAGARQNVSVE